MLKILIVLASLSVATADTANAQYRGSAYDPEPMSFDSLKTTIESKRLTALEQVLAALTPEYRSEFVLMYSSRSVQDASFQNPRVIFFGSDASFITAFNGDPMQRGYDRLEIIQFRKSQRRFEFREIVFRKGQAPEISRPNPPKCLICHQSPARMDVDPRPNWEPYNRWPGAYEKLYRLANYEKDAIQAMPASVNHLKPVLLSNDSAGEEYPKFRAMAPSHPRYRHINFAPSEAEALQRSISTLRGPIVLTDKLAQLNFQRVARLATQNPFYGRYKANLMASLMARATYLPRHIFDWHSARYTPPPLQTYAGKRATFGEDIGLIFHPLGYSTEDWSMDFDSDGAQLAFQFRFGTPGSPEDELLAAFKNADQAWQAARLSRLEEEGHSAHEDREPQPMDLTRSYETTRMMCARCHTTGSGMGAPPIPFDNPEQLSFALSETGYRRGRLLDEIEHRMGAETPRRERMPPVGNLLPEQNRVFIEYLKGLAK